MRPGRQLALVTDPTSVEPPGNEPGTDHGEVFTRRWIVDLILDLVGYNPDHDLASARLIEPSCGTGAFLVPIVERLLEAAHRSGRDLSSLGPSIRAFDLLEANAERTRKAVVDLLCAEGATPDEAHGLAAQWVTRGDFLLAEHEPASADYVVGNPPYIRLESVPATVMAAYRRRHPTMRGRADIYVGFIERGLDLLAPGGALSFICADRWMRNQYGAALRELVTTGFAVDTVMSMHDVDAFEDQVSAYPAVVVLRNAKQDSATVVDAGRAFGARDAARLTTWIRESDETAFRAEHFGATRTDGWFSGRDLWPIGSPAQLALVADLEARFPPLHDETTGTRVGIGVATGCDEVLLTSDADLVEADRLLPLLRAGDITTGNVQWSGTFLVNPWATGAPRGRDGLVDLDRYPRLARYLSSHRELLRARHVARQRPASWFRTIDRVDESLTGRPRLVLPDIKAVAHPVLDEGRFYPHHNLYYVVSDTWDLEVLGGLLLSDVANLFVGAYCVRMRGGTYRFQAQYLRRIRVPPISAIDGPSAEGLTRAFRARDRRLATQVAAKVYGLAPSQLTPPG